jgi:putative hemolysin
LRTALATAEEEGVIEREERAMLEGAMDFRDKLVSEVMTPRIDIVGVPATATLEEVLDVAVREAHSRLPVYEGTPDKIVGVLSTKDLIPHLRATRPPGLASGKSPGTARQGQPPGVPLARDVARPPFFVPENKRIAPTLEQLRHQRSLMAIVVDANGGTAGVVTLEDLLEEIVGEIQDEYDDEEPRLRVAECDAEAVLCDGDVTVRELGRFWRTNFAETIRMHSTGDTDADASLSLAALALQLFDGVPRPGDRIRAGGVLWSAVGNATADGAAGQDKTDEDKENKVNGDLAERDGTDESTRAGAVASGFAATADSPSGDRSPHPIDLEIVSMEGPRIEQVKLEKIET